MPRLRSSTTKYARAGIDEHPPGRIAIAITATSPSVPAYAAASGLADAPAGGST